MMARVQQLKVTDRANIRTVCSMQRDPLIRCINTFLLVPERVMMFPHYNHKIRIPV